jgi:hypothetical protein
MVKKPVIEFVAAKNGYSKIFDSPVLASTVLPQWYKDQNLNIGDSMVIDSKTGTTARTIKACMPVFDLMIAGYVIKAPAEILVKINEFGAPETSWSIDGISLIESHPRQQFDKFSIPDEYYSGFALKFINC